MAKQSVTQLPVAPNGTLSTRITELQGHEQKLFMAGGAVKGLGNLLFTNQCDPIQGITSTDVESIALAVQSLGDHIESISSDIDVAVNAISKQITEAG
jgi:hypothetical protein